MKKLATLAMGLMLSMSVMANQYIETQAYGTAMGVDCFEDSFCLFIVGMRYYELGTQFGYNQALDYFTQSANMGNADAQFQLGYMADKGIGVKQDYQKAIQWYTLSANQGNEVAQYNLGVMYYNGRGTPVNYH